MHNSSYDRSFSLGKSLKAKSPLTGGQFPSSMNKGHKPHQQFLMLFSLSVSTQFKRKGYGKFTETKPRSVMHHFHSRYICKTQFNVKKRWGLSSSYITRSEKLYTNLANRYFVFVILAKYSFHCAKLPHRLIYNHFPYQSQETLKTEMSIPC